MERDFFSLRMGLFSVGLLLGSGQVWAVSFDAEVPAGIRQQMTEDLGFVTSIQGQTASPLHQKIYGGVSGVDYTQFFESRVSGVGLSTCGNANAVACVIPFFDSSKMWITENYIKFSHPQIARLMVVFHEARHTEDADSNWPHAQCPTPFLDDAGKDMASIWTGAVLAGQPACDITPFGSYGSSTILLKNISKNCTTCSEKIKMDAGLYADDQLGRITSAEAKNEIMSDIF